MSSPFESLIARGRITYDGPNGYYSIDYTNLPILEVHYRGSIDDDRFAKYLDDLARVLEPRASYVLLADATGSGVPSAKQRQMQADLIRKHESGFATYCRGAAFVIDSAVVRGALTAILWLQKLPYEHTVVATRDEAVAWLESRLRTAPAATAARR